MSLIIIWGIGAVALTSPTVCHYDAELDIPIPNEGTTKQEREENWASFRYGKYGLEENDTSRALTKYSKCLVSTKF